MILPLLPPTASPAPTPACQVWRSEQAFARSVRAHDAAAFRRFLAADAVFDANGPQPVRGADAVVVAWAPIIAGTAIRLDWQPARVVVNADGTLALSSGPYLLTRPDPGGAPSVRAGSFSTVWRRTATGAWLVQFDGGDAGHPASAAERAAFDAGRDAPCPQAAATAMSENGE